MRKAFFLLVCMLVALSIFSKTTTSRDIELRARHAEDKALRCIIPVRAVLIDETIQIEFLGLVENVLVTITDSEGNEIISEVYNSKEIIRLGSIKTAGNYMLKIFYGDTCLYGEFSIR